MTKVKICGITDVETALFAVEKGADALGFVFAESKRKISVEKAKEIIAKLPNNVLTVGVFVNESSDIVQKIVKETGINAVQFHGEESPEYCHSFSVKVIKAIKVSSIADIAHIHKYKSDYILLDSPSGKYQGGNGKTFDWSITTSLNKTGKKIILAGGLNQENIENAVRMVNPYMVDVSSGVEISGKKDFNKIRMFIERAKNREEAV